MISWNNLFDPITLHKILQGTHVLMYSDGILLKMLKLYREYPFHVSSERKSLGFAAFIMKKNINETLMKNINYA